jgi:AcrR family transcriptional regulator
MGGDTERPPGDIASRLQAPSGSIYHRFGSRHILVTELWLGAVENFQAEIARSIDLTDGPETIRGVSLAVLTWARKNPLQARLLLLHRSSDPLRDGWPDEMTNRNLAQRARTQELLDSPLPGS